MSDADPKAWVTYAEADLAAVKVLLASTDELWDICCYHCQQAAEKSLKALFVAAGRQYSRIHDLAELVRVVAVDHPAATALVWSMTPPGSLTPVARPGTQPSRSTATGTTPCAPWPSPSGSRISAASVSRPVQHRPRCGRSQPQERRHAKQSSL